MQTQLKGEWLHFTCIDEAILVSTDIDGLDIWQLEVPLQVWEDEGGNKACRHNLYVICLLHNSVTA